MTNPTDDFTTHALQKAILFGIKKGTEAARRRSRISFVVGQFVGLLIGASATWTLMTKDIF